MAKYGEFEMLEIDHLGPRLLSGGNQLSIVLVESMAKYVSLAPVKSPTGVRESECRTGALRSQEGIDGQEANRSNNLQQTRTLCIQIGIA